MRRHLFIFIIYCCSGYGSRMCWSRPQRSTGERQTTTWTSHRLKARQRGGQTTPHTHIHTSDEGGHVHRPERSEIGPYGVQGQFLQSSQVCFQASDPHEGLIEVIGEPGGAKHRGVIGADHHRVALGHQHSCRVVPKVRDELQHLQTHRGAFCS